MWITLLKEGEIGLHSVKGGGGREMRLALRKEGREGGGGRCGLHSVKRRGDVDCTL